MREPPVAWRTLEIGVSLKLVPYHGAVGEGEVRGVAPPVSGAIFKAS